MLVQIITENGQKKIIPLTADAGAGLPVGFIAPAYKKGNYSGWLYLDGRDTTGTSEELSTHYPILYAILGSNKLPDYREFALVGAEENTTDVYNASTNPNGTIHDHDVYTEGQAKDDQVQDHKHYIESQDGYKYSPGQFGAGTNYSVSPTGTGVNIRANTIFNGRHGDVTRGKRKAVYFYIKATSGLSENAQDNVVAQLNEERSYSTSEVNTGKKWIDGKPIYKRTFVYENINMTAGTEVSIDSNFPIENTKIINTESFCYKPTLQLFCNQIRIRTSNNDYKNLNALQDVTGGTFNIYFTVYYVK